MTNFEKYIVFDANRPTGQRVEPFDVIEQMFDGIDDVEEDEKLKCEIELCSIQGKLNLSFDVINELLWADATIGMDVLHGGMDVIDWFEQIVEYYNED